MRPIRRTLPQPPAPILPPQIEPESISRAPGQHEELLDRVRNGFREVFRVLDEIAKQRQDIKVIVELDTCVQKEILEVVKEIREIVSSQHESGISKEEEDRLARELDTGSNALAEAVEANQPMGDNALPKKKKKKTK